ncbi:MAG: hypothetical protein ACXVBE_01375 [Bdellovibrionota bacterium]
MKPEQQEALHRRLLSLRKFGLFRALFRFSYVVATKVFLRFTLKINRKFRGAHPPIVSIYLRRGGGRGELIPGASDLDFFLVLEELDAQTEMSLLKDFWQSFRYWKKFFPFLGETLMADRNELANWSSTPTVRAFEAKYSWQLLWGEPTLEKLHSPPLPHLRDVLSEMMKCYWALLRPLLHEPSLNITSGSLSALQFRHAAKAAVDLFRMHHSFLIELPKAELDRLWSASRVEALNLLHPHYGNLSALKPFLQLEDPLPQGEELFTLFNQLIFRAYQCLDEIAAALPAEENESLVHFDPHASQNRFDRDNKYSHAVRELFTERMILRHKDLIHRTLISGATTHIFFPFASQPSLEKMREVFNDLREAGGSFDKSSVAIPLSERTLAELERTSFLDSPFHAFHEHRSMEIEGSGRVRSGAFKSKANSLPQNMLQKTFAEVSLALRFQPPQNFSYVIENMINLVIQLRVAEEHNLIATDFYAALEKYSERHPMRADYLREQVGRYLNLCNEEEDAFWEETIHAANRFAEKHPHRANVVKAQLEALKDQKINDRIKAMQASSDLWTEITPFLRLEMNAMREHFFPIAPKLKL